MCALGVLSLGCGCADTRARACTHMELTHARTRKQFGSGSYEERTDYCGRVLMAIEIEDREGNKAPPSLATTEMKPKDCKLFQDIKQKMFFRFHVFHAQGLNATNAQVTCRGLRVEG